MGNWPTLLGQDTGGYIDQVLGQSRAAKVASSIFTAQVANYGAEFALFYPRRAKPEMFQ